MGSKTSQYSSAFPPVFTSDKLLEIERSTFSTLPSHARHAARETRLPAWSPPILSDNASHGAPCEGRSCGGLNSRVSNWPTAVINAMEAFMQDFRCITSVPARDAGDEWPAYPAGASKARVA